MPPKKQTPGPRRPIRAVATAKPPVVSNSSSNFSDSSVVVESLLNRNEKLSSSQLPDSSILGSILTVPAIPSVSITEANAEENNNRQNSSMKAPGDKICAGHETLDNGTPEFCGSGKEEKNSIGDSGSADGDPLTKNVSEVAPKKKTVKVVKVVKRVVKKRVPKSLLKTVAADSFKEQLASEEIIDDGRERISNKESISLSIQDSGINNLTGSSENKGLEKQAEVVASSFSAPLAIEKCEGGVNMPEQETDSSAKCVGVVDEVENLCTLSNEKEAFVSEIPLDGKTNEAIISGSPVNEERKEAFVSEILPDAGQTECTVEKSDSAIEIPVEVVNDDSIGNIAQVAGTSGYEERKEDSETSNGRIALSGELEALERKRRRKTEIFIGGLNPEAKEEDVRKVFEVVGDIVEMRLMINTKTGKNKGYAFVRYASATDAKKALERYSNVEICGKQCAAQPVEGNDTIFLGNIDKKWKEEDIIKLLQEIGIEKIDKVTVMANPTNLERNRGFAFVELESCRDAQTAFKKLQKDLGKLKNIKVSWAEPLIEPDEEELLKVKSVYAEYLPPSWNEEKIRSYFMKFGEIENVVLSRNLHSSRRKDFAFINFATREAALACIESFNHEMLHDEGSQVYVKVSLAKPVPKGKPQKKVTKSISKETTKKRDPSTYHVKPVDARNKVTSMINVVNQRNDDMMKPTGTSELEQLLAERALRKQMQARLSTSTANEDYTRVMANEDYTRLLPGHKRPLSALGDDLNYLDPRGYSRMRFENSFPIERLSHGEAPSGFRTTSHSYYQQRDADYDLGHRFSDYANSLQREEAPYRGNRRDYRRY